MNLFDDWWQEESLNKFPAREKEIAELKCAFRAGMLAAADIAEPIFENAYPHGNKTVSEVIADEIRIVANAD